MDELERIDATLEALRKKAIADAGALDPILLEQVAENQKEIVEHDRRLTKRPAPPPPPRTKTQELLDAEKQEREIQSRVRRALEDLEAERQAASQEE